MTSYNHFPEKSAFIVLLPKVTIEEFLFWAEEWQEEEICQLLVRPCSWRATHLAVADWDKIKCIKKDNPVGIFPSFLLYCAPVCKNKFLIMYVKIKSAVSKSDHTSPYSPKIQMIADNPLESWTTSRHSAISGKTAMADFSYFSSKSVNDTSKWFWLKSNTDLE